MGLYVVEPPLRYPAALLRGSSFTDTQSQLVMNGYMLFDPTEDNKCSECKYLPICMGGCPHSRLENNQICEQYRYNIDGFLLEYARKITDKEN